jgi:hypothetical protein
MCSMMDKMPKPEFALPLVCREADALTGGRGAKLRGDQIASPAPFALAGQAGCPPEALARQMAQTLPLQGSSFSAVAAAGGYLNFTLSPAWLSALEEQLCLIANTEPDEQDIAIIPDLPVRCLQGDLALLPLLGRRPSVETAARQDGQNPGWLVRYTLRRLRRFGAVGEAAEPALPSALLLAAAQLLEPGVPRRICAQRLVALTEQIWRVTPQRLPPRTAAALAAALSRGFAQLDLQTVHPNGAEKTIM